ncbi:hypothetical protein GUJ93_ZPchr0003g18160 [Zizania palustris]|uniref:Uncharacterized protein n=1 Tax=Zizania palustris TaxID=103762 RepID=A0A8J5S2Z4_ZIZPA|nr:hypothetical protein GUJ93_ZPchr0003g18160 [Zizania palustris]
MHMHVKTIPIHIHPSLGLSVSTSIFRIPGGGRAARQALTPASRARGRRWNRPAAPEPLLPRPPALAVSPARSPRSHGPASISVRIELKELGAYFVDTFSVLIRGKRLCGALESDNFANLL